MKTLRNNQNKTTLKNDELLLINCKMNNNGVKILNDTNEVHIFKSIFPKSDSTSLFQGGGRKIKSKHNKRLKKKIKKITKKFGGSAPTPTGGVKPQGTVTIHDYTNSDLEKPDKIQSIELNVEKCNNLNKYLQDEFGIMYNFILYYPVKALDSKTIYRLTIKQAKNYYDKMDDANKPATFEQFLKTYLIIIGKSKTKLTYRRSTNYIDEPMYSEEFDLNLYYLNKIEESEELFKNTENIEKIPELRDIKEELDIIKKALGSMTKPTPMTQDKIYKIKNCNLLY